MAGFAEGGDSRERVAYRTAMIVAEDKQKSIYSLYGKDL